MIKNILLSSFVLIIALAFTEIVIRMMGFKSYRLPEILVTDMQPSPLLVKDDLLGFKLAPGQYEVEHNNAHTFHFEHNENGNRKLNVTKENNDTNLNLWILGCSFAYGFGVSENETWPALLQKEFPKLHVENLSVPGYGNWLMYKKLKAQIKQTNKYPEIVLINYASFHNHRNTCSRSFRKNLYPSKNQLKSYKMNCVRLKRGKLVEKKISMEYKPLPFIQSSALAELIDNRINAILDRSDKSDAVTAMIIDSIATFCKKNNVDLIVGTITEDEVTKEIIHDRFDSNSICKMYVDYENNAYNLLPSDVHPNPFAHEIYAKYVIEFLENNKANILHN